MKQYDFSYDLEEPMQEFLGPNRMLVYLVDRTPISNLMSRTLQLHFTLTFRNKLYGTGDWGFKKIADTKWRGQDAIMNDPSYEEFGLSFPNMDEKYARLMVQSFQQKKPFKNVVSFSDERTDHRKAYFTSFALCDVKSVVMGRNIVSTIQVARHYYRPIVNFKMVTQEDVSDYDSEVVLS